MSTERHFEAGQILHNNPVGYDVPAFACALIVDIRDDLARAYWNVRQEKWVMSSQFAWTEEGVGSVDDPGVPGMEWRSYYNWGGSPEDDDWDQAEADRPNLAFDGLEVRWYKHIRRSVNANVIWTPDQWVRWYERAQQTIAAWECAEMRARSERDFPRKKSERYFCPFHLSRPCPQYPEAAR
jgi:hypothetical protein